MERKDSSNFRRFCGNDIKNLHKETDPAKKLLLMRRVHAQLYAEACKQNYDNYTICNTVSENLDDYMELSVPFHDAKFDEMMKNMNITLKPASNPPSFDAIDILTSKKCDKVCQNDALFDELDEFFNSMKKTPKASKPPAIVQNRKSASDITKRPVEIIVDENSGDLIFETNFRRNRNNDQSLQNAGHQFAVPSLPSTSSSSSFGSNGNRNLEKRIYPEHSSNNYSVSAAGTSSGNNMPFGPVKRKQYDDAANDIFKKPTLNTNYMPVRPIAENVDQNPFQVKCDFKSASEELMIQYNKKHHNAAGGSNQSDNFSYNTHPDGGLKRSLGGRRTVNSKFVPPFAHHSGNNSTPSTDTHEYGRANLVGIDMSHPRLKNVDAKMIENISNEIMHQCERVDWDSIAGLDYAKKTIMEAVILPILRPDIFTGLRQPARGVLLFGPPGTGKTLIGKCIASQSQSTFFSISASSLTSKWIGEGEKMVRALFAVAAAMQPSVVFIDEVDSLLCQRNETEHESSRRLKTEFLVQLDGAGTTAKDRILIVGATNRPQELDEAARRRFTKRLYVPLPELSARREIMVNLLTTIDHIITESDLEEIARRTDGFSGADMKTLCHEAGMGPVRSIPLTDMKNIAPENVRPVSFNDFRAALKCVRASVSPNDLQQYVAWNNTYGSGIGGN